VLVVVSFWLKESWIRWGVQIPPLEDGKRQFWRKRVPFVEYRDFLPWPVQEQLNRSICSLCSGLGGPSEVQVQRTGICQVAPLCPTTLCREQCKNGLTDWFIVRVVDSVRWTEDRFAIWVVDWGGPKEAQVQLYSPAGTNVPSMPLNHPCAAAMRPVVRLLWPLVISDHIVAQQANRDIVAFHITISYDMQRPPYNGRAVGLPPTAYALHVWSHLMDQCTHWPVHCSVWNTEWDTCPGGGGCVWCLRDSDSAPRRLAQYTTTFSLAALLGDGMD